MSRTGPLELLSIDHLLTEEERDIQATVREWVTQRVKPSIADWYERGDLDLGLMREAGDLGLLGMAAALRAGVIWDNTFNRFDPAASFGGYKESGFGREGGPSGLSAYLDTDDEAVAQ